MQFPETYSCLLKGSLQPDNGLPEVFSGIEVFIPSVLEAFQFTL